MQVYKRIRFNLIVIGAYFFVGCNESAYPNEKFQINEKIYHFLNNYHVNDTLTFQSNDNKSETLVITTIDSSIQNTKGPFINSRPNKSITIFYKQIGRESNINIKEDKFVVVTKYPDDQSLYIDFSLKDFKGRTKNDFGELLIDTLIANEAYLANYYIIKNDYKDLLKDSSNIVELYLALDKEVFAYKQLNNRWWTLKKK